MNELILASASQRRRQILEDHSVRFSIMVSKIKETYVGEPDQLVMLNALNKARDVAKKIAGRGAIVLGADTVVCCGGQILGKPADPFQARKMLSFLSNGWHRVYTALSLVDTVKRMEYANFAKTNVLFKTLNDDDIEAYIATGEFSDKAGGYAIQGGGSAFIERIEGAFDTVVGLPFALLKEMMQDLGYDIKTFLLSADNNSDY